MSAGQSHGLCQRVNHDAEPLRVDLTLDSNANFVDGDLDDLRLHVFAGRGLGDSQLASP